MLRKFNLLRKIGQIALFALLFLWSSSPGFSQQSQVTVRGRVSSDSSALENVNISLKSDPAKATRTDASGFYSINVPSNGVLVFSMVGYEPQEVKVNGQVLINLQLKVKSNDLADVTVIGFGGTRKKASLVSSITSVSVKDLQVPTGNMTNAIAGKVAGMIAFQQSGEPGFGTDNSTFYIRGLSTFGTGKQEPLILIDGVESTPTDMARLQPDDISDFSILKDAAASSIYGARGANGVVLINTKIGKTGAAKFFVRSEARISTNTKNLDYADNITYMNMANEATTTRATGAVALPYSQNKINHTIAGDDPYLYPNNNWIDQLIRKYTINQNHYMSVNGGTEKATYHVSASYGLDNGMLNVDPINDFNNNIKLSKYSLRTNINLKLTPSTEVIIKVGGQFDDYKGPIGGGGNFFGLALRANPVLFPAVYPQSMIPYFEHPLFGSYRLTQNGQLTSTLLINPYAEMVRGYSVYKKSDLQPQLELKQKLDFITKGLNFRTMAYVRRYAFYSLDRKYNPFYYYADVQPDGKTYNLLSYNDGSPNAVPGVSTGTEYLDYNERAKDVDSRIWLEGTLNYARTFKEVHSVGGALISYLSNYESGNPGGGFFQSSLPRRNVGVSGRFTYGYDDRYLAEFNFGYNGSERFDERHRFGFFPSGGVAYRISNEKFFEPLTSVINDLKFRVTYGLVGNDQIGDKNDRFLYLSNIIMNSGDYLAGFGRDDGAARYVRPGVFILRYGNPNITWEQSRQLNLGMDLRMLKGFELTVDAWRQKRTDILLPKSTLESALGLMATPQANYGQARTQGVDLSLKYDRAFNKNWYANITGTFTYATSKRIVVDELRYDSSLRHLSTVGYSLSQQWGFIAERLFVDQKEVANSPQQFGDNGLGASQTSVRGGDIKYRDINGDGLITNDDMVPIGYPRQPEIIYGFGASLRYKKIDFSFLFQGSARSSFFINPFAIQPFIQQGGLQNGLLNVISENYWSETNRNPYAFWPRLSTERIPSNNVQSTWWMRNGNFLRLKQVDLGYDIGKVSKLGLTGGRVYVSATNLFVLSSFKLWDVEMGGNGLGYPNQSVYNLGVEVKF
ncbi:SusC/RagA family TonB-linked outer membrane protein [Terrimonas alba]|uniref:SusC/RagA family TonB-linked outer membrane protein n=1 Tax=Terrimonas alba TaxID=3349636 RepID=UPI0035F2D442